MFGGIINATTDSRVVARGLAPRIVATHPSVLSKEIHKQTPETRDASTSTDDIDNYIDDKHKTKEQKLLNKWMTKQKERIEQRALNEVVIHTSKSVYTASEDDE